jgi:hypothetical protein
MNFLARLAKKKKEIEGALSTPERNKIQQADIVGSSQNKKRSLEAIQEIPKVGNEDGVNDDSDAVSDDDHNHGGDWIDADRTSKSSALAYIPNRIPSDISLHSLVWARYYVNSTFYPARLCSNHESIGEDSIPWPVPSNAVVVEIFGQLKNEKNTLLLMVEKKDVFPFWANSVDSQVEDYDDITQWNADRMGKLANKVGHLSWPAWTFVFLNWS